MDRTSISVSPNVLIAFKKGKIVFEYKSKKPCTNDEYVLHLIDQSIGKKKQ